MSTVSGGKVWSPAIQNPLSVNTPLANRKQAFNDFLYNKHPSFPVLVTAVVFIPMFAIYTIFMMNDFTYIPEATGDYSQGGIPVDAMNAGITEAGYQSRNISIAVFAACAIAFMILWVRIRHVLLIVFAGVQVLGALSGFLFLGMEITAANSASIMPTTQQWAQDKYGLTLQEPLLLGNIGSGTVKVSDGTGAIKDVDVFHNKETNKVFLYENADQLEEARKG